MVADALKLSCVHLISFGGRLKLLSLECYHIAKLRNVGSNATRTPTNYHLSYLFSLRLSLTNLCRMDFQEIKTLNFPLILKSCNKIRLFQYCSNCYQQNKGNYLFLYKGF